MSIHIHVPMCIYKNISGTLFIFTKFDSVPNFTKNANHLTIVS